MASTIKLIAALMSFLLMSSAMLLEKIPEKSKMAECVVKIVESLPKTVVKMTILTSGDNSTFLTEVLQEVKVPVVVNAMEYRRKQGPEVREPNDLVVMTEGRTGVKELLMGVLWRRNTKFLILSVGAREMGNYFEEFWKVKSLNAYALVEEEEGIFLYGYKAFEAGNCDHARTTLLDRWVRGALPQGFSAIAGDARVTNGNKCLVNAVVINLEPQIFFPKLSNVSRNVDGIEARFFNTFTRKFNFTGNYRLPRDGNAWGTIFPPQGFMGELFSRTSDVAFGLISPLVERYENLDLSRPYNGRECVTFIVPAGIGRNQLFWLKNIFSHVTPLKWFFFLASFIAVTTIFSLYLQPMAAFMYVWSSLFGHSITILERRPLRYLTLTWIIFSYLISVIYQASLGSKITVPLASTDIETFHELLELKLKLTGDPAFLNHLIDEDGNSLFLALANRYEPVDFGPAEAIEVMLADRRMTYFSDASSTRYAVYANPRATEKFHILKQCVKYYSPVVALQRNSPFTETLDELISNVFESGIGEHWKDHFVRDIPPGPKKFTPMNLRQSSGIFVILLYGVAVAFDAFLIEVGFFYLRKRVGLRRKK